uniref:Uncharacterized protein n=1 Tax=Arundo donax TaxID=35708 RepID=A0A0A9G6Q9_ARUDO
MDAKPLIRSCCRIRHHLLLLLILCCCRGILISLLIREQSELGIHLFSILFSLQFDVHELAWYLPWQIVERRPLLLGELVRGRLDLLDVALREVVDLLPERRHAGERTRTRLPQLHEQRVLPSSSSISASSPNTSAGTAASRLCLSRHRISHLLLRPAAQAPIPAASSRIPLPSPAVRSVLGRFGKGEGGF